MKNLLILIVFLISFPAKSESVTAPPFSFSVITTQEHLDVDAKLTLICRNEIWVISDSAEFEYKTLEVQLEKMKSRDGDEVKITFSSQKSHKLTLSGMFKPSKECSRNLNFISRTGSMP